MNWIIESSCLNFNCKYHNLKHVIHLNVNSYLSIYLALNQRLILLNIEMHSYSTITFMFNLFHFCIITLIEDVVLMISMMKIEEKRAYRPCLISFLKIQLKKRRRSEQLIVCLDFNYLAQFSISVCQNSIIVYLVFCAVFVGCNELKYISC